MPRIDELINSPAKPTPTPRTITSQFPELDPDELTRLMIQSLSDLGYTESAAHLKQESGLELDSPVINTFIEHIKNGEFESAESGIDELHLVDDSEEVKRSIRFLIRRQKFLEALYVKNETTASALQLIRTEMNPVTETPTIRALTALLMNRDSERLQRGNGWLGDLTATRDNLLNEISKFINPNEMIPKYRLFKLIQQSIQYQKSMTLYQFGDDSQQVSLYEDIKSDKTNFPNTILKTLTDHTDEVWYIAFSNNGKILATASADNFVNLYDVDNDFKLIHKLEGHDKAVMYVSFSPDDTRLLTCSLESTTRLWDVETGECEREIGMSNGSRIWSGDWSPQGDIFVLGSPDKEVWVYDSYTGEMLHKWEGSIINDLKISSDLKLIAVTYDRNIEVWDLKTRQKLKTLEVGERITSISTSKKHPEQVLINVSPNELQLWDWKRALLIAKYVGHKQEKFILRSCFGYDETVVCSGSEDGRVFLWNREFGALLGVFDAHKGNTNCIAWNDAKKSVFASSGDDHVVRIWGPSKK
ncbi:CYFA0S05e00364g1_1 [Cyberlindnera fabianii]|uniref:CYFA0S05e00364g1_1 n=1 Tax=Cyberlindnera fabianii TaxID=36022 RepID=A0A061AYF1_CYBFA|nr:WD repeat-containing protein 26 [Cyberlindnera fabianii]CDR40409.1 CYFA0S05e00364g1_1 [Cyberlindnera fabianii]